MAETPMRLVKRCAEYRPISEVNDIPAGVRGIYVLLKKKRGPDRRFDVVYIGMGRNSVKRRLRGHRRTKADLWDHFSIYEVWDNVRDEEIVELEGLLRHLFRRDTRASKLNAARSYAKLSSIRDNSLQSW
jgi:hypothetical protein